jgi:hypothetical protein
MRPDGTMRCRERLRHRRAGQSSELASALQRPARGRSVPVATGLGLIAYARTNPNKLNMASPGSGTGPHMASELFKLMTGVRMMHVPYRGSGPMLNDLLSGQVQFAFDAIVSSIAHTGPRGCAHWA